MKTDVAGHRVKREPSFRESTLGKKILMAGTGLVLFGFVLGHLAGNLLVFRGPEKLNAYAKFLHDNPGLVWTSRLVLLASVLVHIVTTVQLARRRHAARPIPYEREESRVSTYASRTMFFSGPLIALFVVVHLLHLTTGTIHGSFDYENVYRNVISGFRVWPMAIAYIVAMLAIGLHLSHGIWSVVQTLGANHPRIDRKLRRAAFLAAGAIVLGYISIPLAVIAGLVS